MFRQIAHRYLGADAMDLERLPGSRSVGRNLLIPNSRRRFRGLRRLRLGGVFGQPDRKVAAVMQAGLLLADNFAGRGPYRQIPCLDRRVEDAVEGFQIQDHQLARVAGELPMQVADADRPAVAEGGLPPFRGVETQGLRPRHFVVGVEHSDDGRLPVALGIAGRRQPIAAQVGADKAPLLLVRGKEQVRPSPLHGLEGVLAAFGNHLVQDVFLVIL